ncbi:Lysophospholipid acyltransferase [Lithohypha guttulata]|uniref:Lysophospholipid acyltransferase n=1 Tax=Lithohypha guttulata TaxID=1690604 RepID=UPI002DE1D58E|nr:Lysophospholipid acyltransferase [Lithohypha guttulata]KAK5097875.1 Lysophospholipid acyltransferase [Lithohypha guttulata]
MIPGINAPFGYVAKLTGAGVDDLKLLFSFIISYPLAAVLKRIPDSRPNLKNIYIVSIGLFFLIGLFDLYAGIRTILISAGGTYVVSYYIDGTLMPWIVFVFLMGHMSSNHIIRQRLDDPSQVDITGMQMVMIMKLSAFAWNVHDGRIKRDLLTDGQKEKAIYKMPGFLDYSAYVLFFPALFTGPAFDFNDYKRYIETTMFEVKKGDPAPPTRGQGRIPRSGTPATLKLVEGLVWILLFLQLGAYYYPGFVLTDQYWTYSFPRRVWYLYALGFTSRLKYYGVWTLTEGGCIMSGLGYNGIDPVTKKARWDRLNNVYPWGIESAQNARGYMEGWNKNTNNWLRNYVYLRVTPRGKKPGFRATLITFTTSAFWHGFYPGYYLTFVLGAFVQTVAKNFRRHIRPFFLKPDGKQATKYKIYYDAACWLITQTAFCFVTAPFVILGFSDSIKAWARVYFYCIVGVAASMAFFASPAKVWLVKRLDKRNHPHVLNRTMSDSRMPHLGMPDTEEIDRAVDEIKAEVEERRRRGSKVEFPSGEKLRHAISQRVYLNRNEKGEIVAIGDNKMDLDHVSETINETVMGSSGKKERGH